MAEGVFENTPGGIGDIIISDLPIIKAIGTIGDFVSACQAHGFEAAWHGLKEVIHTSVDRFVNELQSAFAYAASAALVVGGIALTVTTGGAFTPGAVFLTGVATGLISAGVSTAVMTYQQMRTQGCVTATVSDYLKNAGSSFVNGFIEGTIEKVTGGIVDEFFDVINIADNFGNAASYVAKLQANYYKSIADDILVQGITTGTADINSAKRSAKIGSLNQLAEDGISGIIHNRKAIKQTASAVKDKIAVGLSKAGSKVGNAVKAVTSKVKALATKVDDFLARSGAKGFWRNECGEIDLAALNDKLIRNESGLAKISDDLGDVSGNKTLYHYTNEKGLTGITESNKLNASLKANNPKDARYGNGQYLSDIDPKSASPSKLAKKFINVPNKYKYTHYIEIDVRDLNVIQGRTGVFVIPNEEALDLTGRIISFGRVGK